MPRNCKRCGEPLIVLSWNSDCSILTCNTPSCELYRQPMPVPIGATTLAQELGGVYSRQKRRLRRKVHATDTFEERLQELRDEISTQA